MSADLLRRAATRLRAAAEPLGKVRWASNEAGFVYQDFPAGPWLVTASGRPHGDFIALVDPPVALALADLLDRIADRYPVKPYGAALSDAALRAARAVLREDGT